ncbi:hypothetical protein EYB53_011070 [Candidatus Chloroploca sp. M-50]|uniref:PLD phosphodiesterase domain-containing protein n=1 Tax=Candidatus Chloroploca mongolica TaxID=2528176 RepID=A0ABS4D9Y0_9CHLR|nr:hypothetical protein [Candidatus Chloroploca mongolica]MBP1466247.1 hypothetical protein [Candidatus Chloroploca mongolica]
MECSASDTFAHISIRHYCERDFHARFRADLSCALQHVVVLSPFLSPHRAASYYPVLQVVRQREVMVEVYARPKHEQPDLLLGHYDRVKHRLVELGVAFHERPGMHEKVGVVDGHILWHGSLNILSHNESRESMLRFESAELVADVLANLELQPGALASPEATVRAIAAQPSVSMPECPVCRGAMQPYPDISLWICQQSPACAGSLPMEALAPVPASTQAEQLPIACPVCGEPLQLRRVPSIRIACGSPACAFALDSRISAGILRILRRTATL